MAQTNVHDDPRVVEAAARVLTAAQNYTRIREYVAKELERRVERQVKGGRQ
jgi:hypothetical protein